MTNTQWKAFLETARRILGKGASIPLESESWCAWTTYTSLAHELTYWKRGLPDENELLEDRTIDGGLWMQSFEYSDIAHIILPATFYWERDGNGTFESGYKKQDIVTLSKALEGLGIPHRSTDLVLEIKLY